MSPSIQGLFQKDYLLKTVISNFLIASLATNYSFILFVPSCLLQLIPILDKNKFSPHHFKDIEAEEILLLLWPEEEFIAQDIDFASATFT